MRDLLHILVLFLVFGFLLTRFPREIMHLDDRESPQLPFASFLILSPEEHAACIDATRTSWQVRNDLSGRPSVGRLDADVRLLEDAIPPPPSYEVGTIPPGAWLHPPTSYTYFFLPPSMGRSEPAFAIRAPHADADHPPETERRTDVPFGIKEMLSVENSRTLKEIME